LSTTSTDSRRPGFKNDSRFLQGRLQRPGRGSSHDDRHDRCRAARAPRRGRPPHPEVLSAALTSTGFEVRAEADGSRVERAAQSFRPDIALIDMRLGDGVQRPDRRPPAEECRRLPVAVPHLGQQHRGCPGRLRRRRRRLHRQAVRDGRAAGPDARRAAPQRPGDLNVVEVHVSALRKKLEEHGPRIIQTVRGVGYVLRRVATSAEGR